MEAIPAREKKKGETADGRGEDEPPGIVDRMG